MARLKWGSLRSLWYKWRCVCACTCAMWSELYVYQMEREQRALYFKPAIRRLCYCANRTHDSETVVYFANVIFRREWVLSRIIRMNKNHKVKLCDRARKSLLPLSLLFCLLCCLFLSLFLFLYIRINICLPFSILRVQFRFQIVLRQAVFHFVLNPTGGGENFSSV